MNPQATPRKIQNIVARKSGSDYILVPIRDNIADMKAVFTLNETGAFIWELVDGKRKIEQIAEKVVAEFDIDPDTAIKDVMEIISKLAQYLIVE